MSKKTLFLCLSLISTILILPSKVTLARCVIKKCGTCNCVWNSTHRQEGGICDANDTNDWCDQDGKCSKFCWESAQCAPYADNGDDVFASCSPND